MEDSSVQGGEVFRRGVVGLDRRGGKAVDNAFRSRGVIDPSFVVGPLIVVVAQARPVGVAFLRIDQPRSEAVHKHEFENLAPP